MQIYLHAFDEGLPVANEMQGRLQELESLTRAYARYSRSAGGLASVLGGLFCLVSYSAGALAPLAMPWRMVLVAMPGVWLLCKWWLTRRYYQRFGHVEEQETRTQRWFYWCRLVVTLVIVVLVTRAILADTWPHLPPGVIAYVVLLWLLPIAVWRWLPSPLDYVVGVFLFCQAAFVCIGRAYPLVGLAHDRDAALLSLAALEFPLAALAMIVAGVIQHRRFIVLEHSLRKLQAGGV